MEPEELPAEHNKVDITELQRRVDLLSAATIAEMRQNASILFPNETQPKAVELAMIVRNEFLKRLKAELAALSPDADSEFIRIRIYHALAAVRDEIAYMAGSGSNRLATQLDPTLKDEKNAAMVYYFWADKYLRSMLTYIGL